MAVSQKSNTYSPSTRHFDTQPFDTEPFDTEVIIVGGGAVGLFLACRLTQLGVSCRVLERRTVPTLHSRAIGVHPPALEHLAELGLAAQFIAEGVAITRGHAYAGTRSLGTLEFGRCPPPYPFILALPQPRTEALLREHLQQLSLEVLTSGAEVAAIQNGKDGVTVTLADGDTLRARYLVATDGKTSFVRQALNVPFRGGPYPDTYLMGDFSDDPAFGTGLGCDAGLYFTAAGLVESFPLPGGVRRWVVKTPAFVREPTPELLVKLVRERVGARLDPETNTMLSAFGVQRFLAARFVIGRTALVGDAAHVLSPIGGQGMNLGWLGAWRLAESLSQGRGLEAYAQHRQTAQQASARATFNTVMGRATPLAPLRDAAIWGILHTPLRRSFARMFTMRGL